MNDTPRTDAKVFNFLNAHPSMNMNQDVVRADFARDLERENARLREALRDFEDAAYGRGTEDLRERHAEALRDAGVGE